MEGLGVNRVGTQLKGDDYAQLWKASPMSHVEKVTTPTMVQVGLKDRSISETLNPIAWKTLNSLTLSRRCPPSQGRQWYQALKRLGVVETELYEYAEDSHPLSGVDTEAERYINSAIWLLKHI